MQAFCEETGLGLNFRYTRLDSLYQLTADMIPTSPVTTRELRINPTTIPNMILGGIVALGDFQKCEIPCSFPRLESTLQRVKQPITNDD